MSWLRRPVDAMPLNGRDHPGADALPESALAEPERTLIVTNCIRNGNAEVARFMPVMEIESRYKLVTFRLPAETWEMVCDSQDFDLRDRVIAEVKSPKAEVTTPWSRQTSGPESRFPPRSWLAEGAWQWGSL
jgi:hypothetical protein